MPRIAAVLLAAGRSFRMGRPKSLLPWGQSTVVETCIDNLRSGGADEIVVVVGPDSDDVRGLLLNSRVTVALNELPSSEMSVSIARGVESVDAGCNAILIALVDQPAIPPGITQEIIETWVERRPRVIIPEYQQRGGHPVLFDYSLAPRLLNLDPKLGLRSLIVDEIGNTIRLPIASEFILRDVDTIEEYLALHNDVFGFEPALG